MPLPVCTSSQKPYQVYMLYTVVPTSAPPGNTPTEACLSFAASAGAQYADSTAHSCKVPAIYAAGSFPIVQVCEVETPLKFTYEKAADMLSLWWAFVLVFVIVFGLKQILNIFTVNPNGE